MEQFETGILLNKHNIEFQRIQFKNMCKLRGVCSKYYIPRENKHYTQFTELETDYKEPLDKWFIYEEHPKQSTMQRLGWNTEKLKDNIILQVPYDTEELQVGCLFLIPAGLDNAKPRLFRVNAIDNSAIYPVHFTCALGPVYENNMQSSEVKDFTKSNFNMMQEVDVDDD